jgi:hypothetical protein
MYILTFRKSSSKNFEHGLDLAESFGGVWDGQQMTLEIPDDRLLDAYELLSPLFEIIQNWSSTRATFNGAEVKPYPFILYMHFVKECAETSDLEPKNCWLSDDCPGWTCKKLTNILFQESGSGDYKSNERYWYNFGKFNDKNEWAIDKSGIYNRLIQFAEINGLHVCPHFNEKEVRRAIDQMPSKIIPDNIRYRVHFTDFYDKGEKLKFPENIRHISLKYPGSGEQVKRKYDVDKIQPIRHHRSGGIPDGPDGVERSAMNQPKKYHLRVYDNFHYGDESEAYDHGSYPTYEAAMIAAKAIVDEFFVSNWKPGIKPDDLLSQYSLYGEDPVILPNEPGEQERFSARKYAEGSVAEICRKLKNR